MPSEPHVRQLVREALAEVITGLPLTLDRVFQSRSIPFQTVELPAMAIYSERETVKPDTLARGLMRTLELRIDCYADGAEVGTEQADNELHNLIDNLSADIELAVSLDTTLGGIVEDCYLASSDIEFSDMDRLVAVISMRYTAIYFTNETDPTVLIN